MKKGTLYARKLKTAYHKFRGGAPGNPADEPTDPIEQLILAVLSQETSAARAEKAARQLHQDVVDFNELRVSTPAEIADHIRRHVPHSVQRAKTLLRLLNAIYLREYAVSLDALRGRGIRETKAYLETLDGITPYVTASILLWSLGGHAVPVSDSTLEFLKRVNLVDPEASGAEVQAFLERHISAADAKSFCLDLEAYAATNPTSLSGSRRQHKKGTGKKATPPKEKKGVKAPGRKPAARKKTAPRKATPRKTPKKNTKRSRKQ